MGTELVRIQKGTRHLFTEVERFMYNKKIFDTSVRVLICSADSCNRDGGMRSFATGVSIYANGTAGDRVPEQCKVGAGNTRVSVGIELSAGVEVVRKTRNTRYIANITMGTDYSISM